MTDVFIFLHVYIVYHISPDIQCSRYLHYFTLVRGFLLCLFKTSQKLEECLRSRADSTEIKYGSAHGNLMIPITYSYTGR